MRRLADLADDFGAAHIADTARSLAVRVSEGRFYVACVGQFKRGKSTLLNALLGSQLLPTGVVPVTSVPTIIRFGERLAARVRLQNASWVEISPGDVEDYVSEEKNPENKKGVAGIEVFVPSKLLASGMCFVDTPGLGSVFAGNTAATRAFIPHIDAAIVVIGADPPLSGEELQLVDAVSREVQHLLFVLNKSDRTDDSERAAALGFARSVLEKRLGRPVLDITEVSALERLENRGPQRGWPQFVEALDNLAKQSGSHLVHAAGKRGIGRAANRLTAIIQEQRAALERPIEESQRRLVELKRAIKESEIALNDLGVLLSAAQQRLSQALETRRENFLKMIVPAAREDFVRLLRSLNAGRNGPAHRRELNHLAQRIARERLESWLAGEAAFADAAFSETARGFVDLGNKFLRDLAATGVRGLDELPEEMDLRGGLAGASGFRFNLIERVAAPASPLTYASDLISGGLGWRAAMVRDALEFLDQLLEVNTARVESDVDDRVLKSRKHLETEIENVCREAVAVSERAIALAQSTQAAGSASVEAALARLAAAEEEISRICDAVRINATDISRT
ncbi:MAG: dynamin family protein [Candidatus Acidiferrales bacterium]